MNSFQCYSISYRKVLIVAFKSNEYTLHSYALEKYVDQNLLEALFQTRAES